MVVTAGSTSSLSIAAFSLHCRFTIDGARFGALGALRLIVRQPEVSIVQRVWVWRAKLGFLFFLTDMSETRPMRKSHLFGCKTERPVRCHQSGVNFSNNVCYRLHEPQRVALLVCLLLPRHVAMAVVKRRIVQHERALAQRPTPHTNAHRPVGTSTHRFD